MRKSLLALGAVTVGVIVAGSAWAASPVGQLKDLEGKVYVNKGEGFVPAKNSVELYSGDRVMVSEKGSASIDYYLAECDVMLDPSSMTTIGDKAPCKGGATSSQGFIFGDDSSTGETIAVLGFATVLTIGLVLNDNPDHHDNGASP